MEDSKLFDMLEKMMVSLDKSIKDSTDKLTTLIDVKFEEQRRVDETLVEGIEAINNRLERYEVDNMELKTCVLKLEAEVSAIKKRLSIA